MILNIGKSFVVMKWGYYEFFRYSLDVEYQNHVWTSVICQFAYPLNMSFDASKKDAMKITFDTKIKKPDEL